MVRRKLWRVSGLVFIDKREGDEKGEPRVVVVTADNFAAAHVQAHTALEHNWSARTLGSRIESISPVRNDRGDPMEVLIPELE